jgi:hypothetical protein
VQVCIDAKAQVVFFTPRGEALLGAPPVGLGGAVKPDRSPAARFRGKIPWDQRPWHLAGASRFLRDADVPWEVEARALDALDSG